MFSRTQTFLIVFVVALAAGVFFTLVLDAGPFVDGALAGLVAALVLGALQRHRSRTTAGRDRTGPGARR